MTFPRGVGILGVALVVSVALNLFLAGDLLGRRLHRPPPFNFDQRLGAIVRDMPQADQATAQEILERHHGELVEKWSALRPAAQRVNLALRATPFVPEEANAAFDALSQDSQALRKNFQDMLIEMAAKVSPAGREHLRAPGGGP